MIQLTLSEPFEHIVLPCSSFIRGRALVADNNATRIVLWLFCHRKTNILPQKVGVKMPRALFYSLFSSIPQIKTIWCTQNVKNIVFPGRKLRRLSFKTKDPGKAHKNNPLYPSEEQLSAFSGRSQSHLGMTCRWRQIQMIVMFEKFWLRKKRFSKLVIVNALLIRESKSQMLMKNACGYEIVYETEGKTANRRRNSDDFNDSSSTVPNAFFCETKDYPPRKRRKRLRTTF